MQEPAIRLILYHEVTTISRMWGDNDEGSEIVFNLLKPERLLLSSFS
jgi:hypothetical protein